MNACGEIPGIEKVVDMLGRSREEISASDSLGTLFGVEEDLRGQAQHDDRAAAAFALFGTLVEGNALLN